MKYIGFLRTAEKDIQVWKIVRKKYDGPYRSFDEPDKFKVYEVGVMAKSYKLENEVLSSYYCHEAQDYFPCHETTGITSFATRPTHLYKPNRDYTVALLECFIPAGAHYYVGEDHDSYLSDRLMILRCSQQK